MLLEKTRPAAQIQAHSAGPLLRQAGQAALAGLLAAASVRWWAGPLPLALAWAAATDPAGCLAALIGLAGGYVLRWGFYEGFEPAAIGALIAAARLAFRRSGLADRLWFAPAVCGAAIGAVRLAWILSLPFSYLTIGLYFAYALAGAAAALVFRLARQKPGGAEALLVLFGAVLGLGSLPLPLNAGVTAGVAAASLAAGAGANALAAALACGLALALTGGPGWCGLMLALGAGAGGWNRIPGRYWKALAVTGTCAVGTALAGGQVGDLLAIGAGGALALLLPLPPAAVCGSLSVRLRAAAEGLETLICEPAVQPQPDPDAAVIFDRVTERLCRDCPQCAQCWEAEAETTYHLFCAASGPMLQRGRSSPADFAGQFGERCCRFQALLQALDLELDRQLSRRRYDRQAREAGQTAMAQLRSLSHLLRDLAGAGESAGLVREQYRPELSILSAGRFSRPVSGDRATAFQAGDGQMYILICDGMGTGAEAARESRKAADALEQLLTAGAEPEAALELLNGAYLLRGDGAFSTVDLARVDLLTGQVALYKWGAAPSWLVHGVSALRLGRPSPPPGLEPGVQAQILRQRLEPGDYLVLVTDGIGEDAAAETLADPDCRSTRELATRLLSRARSLTGETDDMTAAVLRLHPAK